MRWFLPRILDRSDEFRCIGCFASGEEAIRGVRRAGLQIVLMSGQLPEISGMECLPQLRGMVPGLSVVLVSTLPDLPIMSEATPSTSGRTSHRCHRFGIYDN